MALNGNASLRSLADHEAPVPSRLQLPTELVVAVFQFALPSADFTQNFKVEAQVFSYVRTLYAFRLITKRWQEIVDGTPTLWKFVMSTLPPHVNEATISRSENGSLIIMYPSSTLENGDDHPSAQDFVDSLAHTFPRWSAYIGPVIPGYFDKPAPHLQTIVLRNGETYIAVLELLGGSAANLRHVEILDISIRWKTGLFAQLKFFGLRNVNYEGEELTTTHLLDALQASPGLERLYLDCMSAIIDHPPSSPVITLPRLRYINVGDCNYSFTGMILHQIRAPACTEFYLNITEGNHEQDLPRFLNEDLGHFRELLHAIHSRNGFSEITLGEGCFGWNSPAEDVKHLPAFSLFMICTHPIPFISWLEQTLQGDRGLSIRFIAIPNVDREVLESIKPMRCVTRVAIGDLWDVDECLIALRFIGEPPSTDPTLPSLPCLQELLLTGADWTTQNVLDMVLSRFNPRLWEGTERTPLTISMSRGAFSAEGSTLPISDLTILARIRETEGVECVRFVGSEELDGTLAITWDEKESAPARG